MDSSLTPITEYSSILCELGVGFQYAII